MFIFQFYFFRRVFFEAFFPQTDTRIQNIWYDLFWIRMIIVADKWGFQLFWMVSLFLLKSEYVRFSLRGMDSKVQRIIFCNTIECAYPLIRDDSVFVLLAHIRLISLDFAHLICVLFCCCYKIDYLHKLWRSKSKAVYVANDSGSAYISEIRNTLDTSNEIKGIESLICDRKKKPEEKKNSSQRRNV